MKLNNWEKIKLYFEIEKLDNKKGNSKAFLNRQPNMGMLTFLSCVFQFLVIIFFMMRL